MKNLLCLSIVFLFISCHESSIENLRNNTNNINIFLVKEGQVGLHNHIIDLDTLDLEPEAWIKSSDIEFYDWSAHAFYLNKEASKDDFSGRKFVVTGSGGKRLFVGVFWPMYMSSIPMIPAIFPEDDWFNPKDVIRFNSFGWYFPESLNDNSAFKSELVNADLLKEGIDVRISRLKKRSSSALEYTFEINNLESESIYVIDPNKMGTKRFHYFTNGVSLRKDNKYYSAQGFETIASEEINSNWYCKILPGTSISRTVKLEGFQSLPTGIVEVHFHFPGTYHLERGEWKKPDGRIWIGDFRVRTESMLD